MNMPSPTGGHDPSGSTVGIQDHSGVVGVPYAFRSDYAPGAATIEDGAAILFTTDARILFGTVEGTVIDAETELPLEGVTVSVLGAGTEAETNESGFYRIETVLIGTYSVRASATGFNDATTEGVTVEHEQTATVNLSMLHPELELSTDGIVLAFPPDNPSASFQIINNGNGPLDYDIEVVYRGEEDPVDPWGLVTEIDVSELTGNLHVLGCEFAGDFWYVSASGGPNNDNYLFQFDVDGNFVGTIVQPTSSAFGWRP